MTPAHLPATETLTTQNADCALTVTADLTQPGVLRLRYEVRNTGALPLYFLNQLWRNIRRDARTNQQVFEVLPDLVNIEVTPETVLVHKAVVDVPYGLLVEVRRIPCLAHVAPGAAYAETLTLPLPLQPYTPYESDGATGPVVSRALRVELGYLRGLPHVVQLLEPVTTPTGTAFYLDAFPARQQSIIGAGPFQAPVLTATQLNPYPPKPAETSGWTPWS